MLATMHLADLGMRSALPLARKVPQPATTPGLRDARVLLPAPLAMKFPAPQVGRFAMVAFWDDDATADAFLASDTPLAEALDSGWSARLEPLRAIPESGGHFPGVADELPSGADDGALDAPVAVLTIGLLHRPRLVPFLIASRRAERQVLTAPGLLWASGFTNLGQAVVATFSLWESSAAAHDFAMSTSGHTRAMAADGRKSFHRFGSFVRFRPYDVSGSLGGRNPLSAEVSASLEQAPGVTNVT